MTSTNSRKQIPRPVVKWAGGKTQLLSELWKMRPRKFNTYYEPFVGGGALFFYLYRKGVIGDAILTDLNEDIIQLYGVICDSVEKLIRELKSSRYEYDRETYESIRKTFNRCRLSGKYSSVRQAARMLYLNKTCFNGLFRLNDKGFFNVPFGKYKDPRFLDEDNLRASSDAFKSVVMLCDDFESSLSQAQEADFIYLDPPYVPLNSTSVFTHYVERGFEIKEQERLAKVFARLDDVGCYVLQSNSATDEIRELYSGYYMKEVEVSRLISSKVSTRSKIPELLISNYDPLPVQQTLSDR